MHSFFKHFNESHQTKPMKRRLVTWPFESSSPPSISLIIRNSVTFHPLRLAGGVSIARLVFPHALGNAAAI